VRQDQRFAFIGDLAWPLDGITHGVQCSLLMRMLADSDSAQVRQNLARVAALSHPWQIVLAHDARGCGSISRRACLGRIMAEASVELEGVK
jgi:hypothetical protein